MINVLQISIGGKTYTGIASYLREQYLHVDRSKLHYDFLFCRENSMELVEKEEVFSDSDFTALGAIKGKSKSTDYVAFIRGIKKVLRTKKYDYVIVNTSVIEVIYACLIAMKVSPGTKLIAHAHNAGLVLKNQSIRKKLSFLFRPFEEMLKKQIRKKADYLFACSEDAGIETFGRNALGLDKFRLVRNAIDLGKFHPDHQIREKIRAEAGIQKDGDVVYGCVGSLSKRKNQSFLLKVFKIIKSREPNAKLWLVGEGEEKATLIDETRKLGLDGSVIFWGQRSDVDAVMNGMDCFVFPSLSEGLGIVAIEAQAVGLPTIVSDGLPGDVMLSDSCKMISLKRSQEEWAQEIIAFRNVHSERVNNLETLVNLGYDVKKSAKEMVDFYLSHLSLS